MDRRMFVSVLVGSALAVARSASAQTAPPPRARGQRWGQQAEKEFWLGRGLGPKLMTEEEWTEHQQKMRTMTAEERERYREQVHQQMMERAKEQGVALPRAMEPPGPGGGMGSRGGRGR
jgi:hypothetical protein